MSFYLIRFFTSTQPVNTCKHLVFWKLPEKGWRNLVISWFHCLYCLAPKAYWEKMKKNCDIKKPTYQRHRITRPMPLIAPIYFFKIQFSFLRLYESVHKCTSQTPPTRGPFMGAIWNNSLFLGIYESVNECTSPAVKHLPCVDDSCMQFGTTPHF